MIEPDKLRDWQKQVVSELEELRSKVRIKETELAHINGLIDLQEGRETPQALVSRGRSLSGRYRRAPSIGGMYEEIHLNGMQFDTVGEFLDYVGEPHYFSKVRGRQKDEAARQVLRWARKNPDKAAKVLVRLKDGLSVSLWDLMIQQGWR